MRLGDTLLSGSDDTRVCIWDTNTLRCRTVLDTGHSANIFCVRYMPNTGTWWLQFLNPSVQQCSSSSSIPDVSTQPASARVFPLL